MRIYDKLAELWILRLETRTSKAENAKNCFSDIVPIRNHHSITKTQKFQTWAVVVAQLSKRSLPTLEVRGLNPIIGKVFIEHC